MNKYIKKIIIVFTSVFIISPNYFMGINNDLNYFSNANKIKNRNNFKNNIALAQVSIPQNKEENLPITLDGNELKFPIKVKDILSKSENYYIGSDGKDLKVKKGAVVKANLYLNENPIVILVENNKEGSLDIEEGYIKAMEINDINKEGQEHSFNIFGITKDSNINDIFLKFKEPIDIFKHGSLISHFFKVHDYEILFDINVDGKIENLIITKVNNNEDTTENNNYTNSTSNNGNLSNANIESRGGNLSNTITSTKKNSNTLFNVSSNANLSNSKERKTRLENQLNGSRTSNTISNMANESTLSNTQYKNIDDYIKNKKEFKLDKRLEDYKIKLENVEYTLPFKVQKLLDNGWVIDNRDKNEKIPYMKYTILTRFKKSSKIIEVQVANFINENDIPLEEGTVVDLTLPIFYYDENDPSFLNFQLFENITAKIKYDELIPIFKDYIIEDGDFIRKVIYKEGVQKYYEFIFNKEDGNLLELHIRKFTY